MPHITRELLRKRAEHNEGMISTLEEISLHQEELEAINDVLATTCRKLKILYLQNNIIPKMENLHHMKDLQYLNLALNNITKIEGIQNCEFLRKLDLTVNFIDFDTLAESIDHLKSRINLEELYMLGNPVEANWPNFQYYVIGHLPQLVSLDGKEITKTMQIKSRQMLPKLESELEQLATETRIKKATTIATEAEPIQKKKKEPKVVNLDDPSERTEDPNGIDEEEDAVVDDEMTENTPQARIKIYQELAQQKKEKEDRANVNAPKQRHYEQEHQQSIANIREKEEQIVEKEEEIKQKNEGGYTFYWDEDSQKGKLCLEIVLSKHLDSSLIDVDVHPMYVSIIIKSKLLRLKLPCEVKASDSKCQRSKTTGSLVVMMPKMNTKETLCLVSKDTFKQQQQQQGRCNTSNTVSMITKTKKLSMQEMMLQEALLSNGTNGTGKGGLLDDQIGGTNNSNTNTNNNTLSTNALYVTSQGKQNLLQLQQS